MTRQEARARLLGRRGPDEPPVVARDSTSRRQARQQLLDATEVPADSLRELVRWKPCWALLGAAALGFVAAQSPAVQTLLMRTLLDSIGLGSDRA